MSVAVTEDRLKRLLSTGIRGVCRPAERLSELRGRASRIDELAVTRMEQVFFGLSDRTRLKILHLLAKEELCECEVTAALGLTQPTTSHHLSILARTGLVQTRREGKWVFYLSTPSGRILLSKGLAAVRRFS